MRVSRGKLPLAGFYPDAFLSHQRYESLFELRAVTGLYIGEPEGNGFAAIDDIQPYLVPSRVFSQRSQNIIKACDITVFIGGLFNINYKSIFRCRWSSNERQDRIRVYNDS